MPPSDYTHITSCISLRDILTIFSPFGCYGISAFSVLCSLIFCIISNNDFYLGFFTISSNDCNHAFLLRKFRFDLQLYTVLVYNILTAIIVTSYHYHEYHSTDYNILVRCLVLQPLPPKLVYSISALLDSQSSIGMFTLRLSSCCFYTNENNV